MKSGAACFGSPICMWIGAQPSGGMLSPSSARSRSNG